jgi:hypothetical protein
MQRTTSSGQVDTRISPVKPFFHTFCLVVFCGLSLHGQVQKAPAMSFVDSLTQIIVSEPAGSAVQTAAAAELRAKLLHVARYGAPEQKGLALRAVQELDYKTGVYKALLPPPRPDTLGREVLALEAQLKKWQDSITHVQQALIGIIEDDGQTRATREKAVLTLAKIHNKKVLDYLFENEGKLNFGPPLSSEDHEAWDQEVYRTGMHAIVNEYFYKEDTEVEKWLLFKYLLHDLKKMGVPEVALVSYFLSLPERYQSQELLIEFIDANANPKTRELMEFLFPKDIKQKD